MVTEKQVVSIITSKKLETGFWTVDYELIQSRKEDDKEWESKSLTASVSAVREESAFSQVVAEIYTYLNSVNGDLFSNPDIGKESEKWKKTPM